MQIAWIGLGNMGHRMAGNLATAGHSVVGHDISNAARDAARASGVTVAHTTAHAVTGAEIVFISLPRAEHVASVLGGSDGILANAPAGAVIIDTSTIDVTSAVEFHGRSTDAGFRFLDAPVSGGISGAAAGTLTFMVGGDASVLEEVRPVLGAMAGNIFHVGGPGKGQAAKAVNNMMLAISLAATSEGAVLAERLGLDAHTFHALVTVSTGDSWAVRNWYPIPGIVEQSPANRGFQAGFSVNLLAKDLDIALRAGESVGLSLHHASGLAEDLRALIAAGDGDKDCTWLVSLVDEPALP